jgi:hypothetical protein
MTAYTISSGERAVHSKQLAAGVSDTVTLEDGSDGLEVLSDGSAALFFSVDGTTATVGGGHCYELPQDATSANLAVSLAPGATVSLISSAGVVYSVVAGDVELGGEFPTVIDGGVG